MIIASSENKKFRYWKSLTTSKGLKNSEHCLIAGRSFWREHLDDQVDCILLSETHREGEYKSINGVRLKQSLFRQIDTLGTNAPLLVKKQPKLREYTWPDVQSALILPLGDPNNLGNAIRSAVAFSMDAIVLLGTACHPFLPRVTRAAAGLNFKIPIFSSQTLPDQVTALDMTGDPIEKVKLERNLKLYAGEEGQGVPQDFSGRRVRITTSAHCESLNVANALAIALYLKTRSDSE